MKSNVIDIFTRQYIEVSEPELTFDTVRKEDHVPTEKPKRKRKPKNQPTDLAQERLEHNESVKRQYRLT